MEEPNYQDAFKMGAFFRNGAKEKGEILKRPAPGRGIKKGTSSSSLVVVVVVVDNDAPLQWEA